MSAVNPPVDLRALKKRHPLADIVEASGVRLKGRGRMLQGLCPFHPEHEPSFTVYQDTQRFYCFGCGAKGDMLEFLRMRDGLTLPEAIERLDGHIRTPSTRTLQPKAQLLQTASRWPVQRDRALFTAAQRFYAGNLRRSHDAKYYLLRRGISLRTAAMLGLGYATGQGLREHLERLGFTLDRIARSGLFQGERERFAGRVTVPDVRHGRVVWLIGRSITDSEPRFQALPGEKPLLGLGRLADLHVVVVTEGVFDWLALIQWGLPACARWDATLLSMQPDPWLLRGRSTWSWTTTSPVGMQLKSFRACSARGPSRCVCLRV